eukprot:3356774-Alexandrium_andersonii.AAC.1
MPSSEQSGRAPGNLPARPRGPEPRPSSGAAGPRAWCQSWHSCPAPRRGPCWRPRELARALRPRWRS